MRPSQLVMRPSQLVLTPSQLNLRPTKLSLSLSLSRYHYRSTALLNCGASAELMADRPSGMPFKNIRSVPTVRRSYQTFELYRVYLNGKGANFFFLFLNKTGLTVSWKSEMGIKYYQYYPYQHDLAFNNNAPNLRLMQVLRFICTFQTAICKWDFW